MSLGGHCSYYLTLLVLVLVAPQASEPTQLDILYGFWDLECSIMIRNVEIICVLQYYVMLSLLFYPHIEDT